MKEAFVDRNFSSSSMEMISIIQVILSEYQSRGYDLSLRQLYYQLVARGVIENSDKSYKRIGSLVNDARLAGLLDWSMIQDRGRVPVRNSHWDSPSDIIESAAASYRVDRWSNQNVYIELMVEKQALEGVLIPVCQKLDIMFSANKGYSSASALYNAGKRARWAMLYGKDVVILYLGDHDPSGIDMTRDVQERLELFSGYNTDVELERRELIVHRLALNMDQIEELKPPPNPAKETDARFDSYYEQFGPTCWELDAIEPGSLADLVEEGVFTYRDPDLLTDILEEEEKQKDLLRKASQRWEDIERFLEEE